ITHSLDRGSVSAVSLDFVCSVAVCCLRRLSVNHLPSNGRPTELITVASLIFYLVLWWRQRCLLFASLGAQAKQLAVSRRVMLITLIPLYRRHTLNQHVQIVHDC